MFTTLQKGFLSNIVAMFGKEKIIGLVFIFFSTLASAQSIGTGQWRIHLPLGNTIGITETSEYIYTWANYGFYRYHKQNNTTERLSKIQGFSDVAVSHIAYNAPKDILLIAYQDGNIDMVRGGAIINISDIKRAFINGSKKITNIIFLDNLAYIASAFGVLVLDMEDISIRASYKDLKIGTINDVALWNNKIYVATSQGIYNAPQTGLNLNDPASWTLFDADEARMLRLFENKLFVLNKKTVKYFDGSTWIPFFGSDSVNTLFTNGEKLLINRLDTLVTVEKNLSITKKFINTLTNSILATDGTIWYTTPNAGTIHINKDGRLDFTLPNGPYNINFGRMTYVDDEVIVAGGQIGGNFRSTFSKNGYYRYINNKWENSIEKPNPITDTLSDIYALAADAKTKDVWIGAYFQGLLRLNGGEVKEVYTPRNSPLKLNIINFITGLAIDKNGHLWVANYGSDSALIVRTKSGEWQALTLGNIKFISQIVVDDRNRKWIVAPRNSGFGLLVYDDDNTPLNPNKHLGPKNLSTITGQGGLPDNQVNCIAKDRDGEIWVGTQKGPAVFSNPSNIFSAKPSDARQIVIGEGTSTGNLLGSEVINSIYVDGGNRKWFGTNNGAWLVSADGQQILQNFNVDNSPLFSNSVLQIQANEKTGEVFFATALGIISYKSDASEAQKTHGNVLVYPNPVRENFEGLITINGLAQDANVKITDIAGKLIYETRANGGLATWDGNSFDGRRASTGVYLIFSGTDDASDTFVAKVLFINGEK